MELLGKLRKTAETSAADQEEIKRLKRDLENSTLARTEEMSALQRENESQQTKIRELKEKF